MNRAIDLQFKRVLEANPPNRSGNGSSNCSKNRE